MTRRCEYQLLKLQHADLYDFSEGSWLSSANSCGPKAR
jgi:hypothetical protein